ncbi:memba protein, partial [Bifidobacterium longum]
MLRTKHFKMAVVPMTVLALLSTAVRVASAQETTDETFYELTTTPSRRDKIVGERDTTMLFDYS